MINSFLVTLYNVATPPVNGSSTMGNVLWPDTYLPRTFSGAAAAARAILFATNDYALDRFHTAIQLLWVVENSVCADTITHDDPRITYTRDQLLAQFVGGTAGPDRVEAILSSFDDIDGLGFLTGDLAEVYRSAGSRLDRLAAVICFFGLRDA